VLGGASLALRPLSTAPSAWIQIMFDPQNLLISSDSARHLVFSANNDIYVLPSAFFHVERQPPQIAGIAPGPDARTITLMAVNVTPETRYLFDGVQGQVRAFEEIPGGSRVIVAPPQAAPGHRAVVTALNRDGPSSLFLQSDAPAAYSYPADGSLSAAGLILAPNNVPAGVESMIQIDAPGAQFAEGQVAVSFGTAQVAVRRTWVVSPTRLMVNVSVSGSAQLSIPTVTVVSGLQVIQQPQSFVVQGPVQRPFWLNSLYLNPATGQPSVSAGAMVTMLVGASPAPVTPANTSVLLNDTRVPLLNANSGQITFQIPAGTPAGPVAVRLEASGERSLPIAIPVEGAVARILAASTGAGDLVALSVAGLTDDKVTVMVGARAAKLIAVLPDGDKHIVMFQLPEDAPRGETVPVTLVTATGASEPFSLKIGG
jgi:hypothetical protein